MIQRFDVGARLSEMAIHNGTVYLAGQLDENHSDGIEAVKALRRRLGGDLPAILITADRSVKVRASVGRWSG